MTNEEILDYNIRCSKFLDWKETTEQFKIDWTGCKTKERLERMNKEYIPILEKDGNVLFSDFSSINFHKDWNSIHEVIEKINKSIITAPMNGIPDSITPYLNAKSPISKGLLKNDKEKVVEGIYKFLKWYEKNK